MLRKLAELDPSDLKVQGRLADLYTREGDQEKAAGEYIAIADELIKKGKLAEALQVIDKALRSGPRSPKLLSAAAHVHIVQKDYAKAIELLEEARRATPADREVSLRLAEAYLGARRAARRAQGARGAAAARRERPGRAPAARAGLPRRGPLRRGVRPRSRPWWTSWWSGARPSAGPRCCSRSCSATRSTRRASPSSSSSTAQTKNDMLVAQTYGQMVEAYMATGGHDQAASILEMLVQLEPHNEQHRTKLRWLKEQGGARRRCQRRLRRRPHAAARRRRCRSRAARRRRRRAPRRRAQRAALDRRPGVHLRAPRRGPRVPQVRARRQGEGPVRGRARPLPGQRRSAPRSSPTSSRRRATPPRRQQRLRVLAEVHR